MLEPMNASDRKVIHDAVSEIAGVRSYSEGEPPDRYVVISVDTSDDDETSALEDDQLGATSADDEAMGTEEESIEVVELETADLDEEPPAEGRLE